MYEIIINCTCLNRTMNKQESCINRTLNVSPNVGNFVNLTCIHFTIGYYEHNAWSQIGRFRKVSLHIYYRFPVMSSNTFLIKELSLLTIYGSWCTRKYMYIGFFPFSIQNIYLQMRVKYNLASQKTKQSDKRYRDLIEYYQETSHISFIIILTSL